MRSDPGSARPDVDEVTVTGDLTDVVDLGGAVAGADVVLHLAARVHVMHDRGPNLDAIYRRANVEPTLRLAHAAAAAGARRFVYVSSVKAVAECSAGPLDERSSPAPDDAYGRSKLEAERALTALNRPGFTVVIVRPPLVYGPGVRGNFQRLIGLVRAAAAAHLPLPLGGACALRSLVYVGNLADALALVCTHPEACGTYFVRDGEDLGTAALVHRLGTSLGIRPRLVTFPAAALRVLGTAIGRRAEVDRLFNELRVDDGRLRRELQWDPPFDVDAGLAATVHSAAAGRQT